MQVLEPICEAKFHDRSNGFRPNRGAENALAQLEKLIQMSNLHIVTDIDIKGFFENVNHGKLLKQKWLKDRLGLEISSEKSKIINLKHQYSDFLGFRIKVHKKGKNKKTKEKLDKWVVVSHVSDKALRKIKVTAKEHIKAIQFAKNNELEYRRINHYNSYVMGIHNYYRMATKATADFHSLAFNVKTSIKIRLQERVKRKCENPKSGKYVREKYGKSKEVRYVNGNFLVPIGYVSHSPPIHKKKVVNKYTEAGRKEIHKMLERIDVSMVHSLMRNPVIGESAEYNDNRISLYVAQCGKCAVTAEFLEIEDIHCHHKKMKKDGGNDVYSNLILLSN